MSARDRVKWNNTYQEKASEPYPRPDLLLLDYTPPPHSRSARALDFAGGRGQNGLWLASQGYIVDIMDISRVALDQARAEIDIQRLRTLNLLAVDLDTAPLDTDAYEVVCVFRYLNRDRFPDLAAAVKPGGRLIYETFTLQYLDEKPDFNPDYLLAGDELATAFEGWRIVHNTEEGSVARFVAIKPSAE